MADNDAAGVVINQTGGQLRVFEGGGSPSEQSLVVNTYTVVLTRAPEQNVRVTASPVAMSQTQIASGAKGVLVNGSAVGVTLLFDRTNWYVPQTVTITAPEDFVAEGTRMITIQHSVTEGATPDDGDPYDNLPVLGVSVQVIDNDSASVAVVPYNEAAARSADDVLVAEGATCSRSDACALPGTDAYAVVLTKAPTGTVTITETSDSFTQLWSGTAWVTTKTLTFNSSTWNVPQIVRVSAVDDLLKQGLHFSRIQELLTSDTSAFLGVTATDVAQGLANAVNGDVTGQFDATAAGNKVTVTGPAFTLDASSAGQGTLTIDASSVHAFAGPLTVTVSGTVVANTTWTLTLNGLDFTYVANATDGLNLPTVASKLAAVVGQSASFDATANGATLTITQPGGAPFTAVLKTGSGSIAGALSTTAYASLVLDVNTGGVIPSGSIWSISPNAGTTPSSAVPYRYVVGSNHDSAVPKPLDVQVADNDAPGVLVLQTHGSTDVTEPTSFAILGDGFVTSVINGCGASQSPVTCFYGDFGTAELNESPFHASVFSAQDLDLGSWSTNANPDIAPVRTTCPTDGSSCLDPHITVHGTGDGNDDFYKFTVTQAMIDNAPSNQVKASFDVDNGFNYGDPILWLSHLKLYDSHGVLIAQGPGYSDPFNAGAGGSQTWLDDYLAYTFTHPDTYVVEVGAWLFSNSLPTGVNYDLQVEVQQHATAGFVFSASPILENETGNNSTGTPQNVDNSNNFFTFFNPNVGDGGTINFQTPYAQIQGSGDGTLDVYSFQVTQSMLNPAAITAGSLQNGSGQTIVDGSTFFTKVGLVLNGVVKTGDVWTLGLGYRDYSVTATSTDTPTSIATKLGNALRAATGYTVTTSGATITVTDPSGVGFNLKGITANGVSQLAQAAAAVTRSTTAVQAGGSTPISFTSASIALSGTPNPGELWTIDLNNTPYQHMVPASGELLSAVAAALVSAIGSRAHVSSTSDTTIVIDPGAAFSIDFKIAGASPTGQASITGTPVATQASSVPWTEAQVTIPTTVRPGERWTLTFTTVDGTSSITSIQTVGSSDTDATLAASLQGVFGASIGVFTTHLTGSTIVVDSSTPFTSSVHVDPSGSTTVDATAAVSHTVTVNSTYPAADSWTIVLFEHGTATLIGLPKTVDGSTTADTIASELAAAVSTITGFTAIAEGSRLTITRTSPAGTDFDIALAVLATSELGTPLATYARVVTIGAVSASDTYTLTVDGTPYTATAGLTDPTSVANDLAGRVGGSFVADNAGAVITIISTAGSTFDATLTIGRAPAAQTNATTNTYTVGGTQHDGDHWTIDLPGVTPTGAIAVSVNAAEAPSTIAGDLAAAINSVSPSAYYATSSGSTLTISRLAGGAFTATPGGGLTLTAGTTTVAVETFTVPTGAVAGDDWALTLSDTGGTLGTATEHISATDQTSVADGLATGTTPIGSISGFSAVNRSGKLIVTRTSTTAFTFALTVSANGAESAQKAATLVTLGGTPRDAATSGT